MAEKKVTKKENFLKVVEVLQANDRNDLAEVILHEIELLEKKAMNSKKTKTQEANEDIKDLIVAELVRIATPVTITELLQQSEELANATNNSNQKVSALMTQLKNTGRVSREQVGKKATFTAVEE